MNASATSQSRRYAREQAQEDQSEAQFRERFAQVGWPCDRLGRDLGEDLAVRIYDDGASTGLMFHVQLKSTARAERLTRKKTPALAYRLEVKDLKHWEVSATLVVLVVWDVDARVGWWRPIPEIIKDLDTVKAGWRKKRVVSVSVPLVNGTDGDGLERLRWVVADHYLPIVPKPETMTFSLTFPETTEGLDALRTLERALDQGDAVTFEHGFIPTMEYPAWLRRIYGKRGPGETIKIEIKPTQSIDTKAVRVEIESSEGPAVFPYVELRPMVQGRKRVVLTNEQQNLAVTFSFEIDEQRHAAKFGFKRARLGNSVYEAKEIASFMLAATTPGSRIRIVDPRTGELLLSLDSSRASLNYDPSDMRRWRDVLDKLCFIQQCAARFGTITQEALQAITMADVEEIDCVFQILREGRVEVVRSYSWEIVAGGEPLPDCACTVHFELRGVQVKLLGLEIPLGDVRADVVDSDRFMKATREAYARAAVTGETITLRLEDLHLTEEYINWLPGNVSWPAMYETLERLSAVVGSADGYFTRADARAAGASDPIFDAVLTENKIEQVAPDVFHLTHFPRSDNEDLIALWLQTDRKGVFSHETALFLHDLSDGLPARRNITVPPEWSPGERQLAPDVVLHHGEVSEDELRWLGPVPYTAPLRTLRDCVEASVSPDLVEQAVASGLRRGLFTEADLPPGLRARAA